MQKMQNGNKLLIESINITKNIVFVRMAASSNAPPPFVSKWLFSKCDKTVCFPIRADE